MKSDEIREAFLSYFESKGHLRVASSSLIPVGDPTLLLTNAGMVQFKPYFAGAAAPPNRRLTTSQKSFRTVDIDEVGDSTHLTMFEMLGNFSIGDYFKEGAIDFALDCLANVMGLPRERFAITVHDSDDEAFDLWLKAGVPEARIFRFGDEDNWWGPPIHGTEGPCGPCSELHYDFGAHRGCGQSDCGPNCANVMAATGEVCDRYVELWNLVFMQFNRQADGRLDPLPAPSIDTGMGLERLAVVLQDAGTIYETDLFLPLLRKVEEVGGREYDEDSDTQYAMRVVAEHARSATFLIADGVVPANEGRGYVLRRVIRRAIRHARRLGIEDAFLAKVARVVTRGMGAAYPELHNHEEFVQTVLRLEEQRFQQAFENGYAVLSDSLGRSGTLSGEVVFKLWDTYGFPVEITQEIARERGVEVDLEGFEAEMETQRQRARAAARFTGDRAKIRVYESLGVGATGFLGYEQVKASSVVVGLITGGEVVSEAREGDEVEVALLETPFYPEGGGQVGDAGELVGAGGKVEVRDTQTVMPGLIVHIGTVDRGAVALGDAVDAYVDTVRREDTARNHTATHLLHAALRQVLGAHVRQAGSLVAPDRLRFDFSHVEAMSGQEIEDVELLVNEKILQNATVHKSEDAYSSAVSRGALAFFGDKYDERVRLVEIANGATFSFEVCGGTHVEHTGELGAVYVLGESSVGAGLRRIEAVSGRGGARTVRQRLVREDALARLLQTSAVGVEDRVRSLLAEADDLRRRNEALERRLSLSAAEGLLDRTQDVDGVAVLAAEVSASSADALRETGDWLRDRLGSGVVVLGSVVDGRPSLVAMVTADLVAAGLSASDIVKGAARAIQGGGGGRADVAQAGGRRADKLHEALGLVPDLVREKAARA
jgi:alanyl-tRNA synthetase